jgi:hypothetical protein
MSRRRRKSDFRPDGTVINQAEFESREKRNIALLNVFNGSIKDYFKFAFYCMLLAVPLYAITVSVISQNWLMAVIDALIVPIGFIHGLLLIFGYVG